MFECASYLWETNDVLTPEVLREDYVTPHVVFLKGFARFVRAAAEERGNRWTELVCRSEGGTNPIPVTKPFYLERCVGSDDRILTKTKHEILVCNTLKKHHGLELNPSEQEAEILFEAEQNILRELKEKRSEQKSD